MLPSKSTLPDFGDRISSLAAPSPCARRGAGDGSEGAGEMALVGKATGKRHLCQAVIGLEQGALRAPHPLRQVPAVRRHTGGGIRTAWSRRKGDLRGDRAAC